MFNNNVVFQIRLLMDIYRILTHKPIWKDTYVYAITEDEYENRKMSGTADGIL